MSRVRRVLILSLAAIPIAAVSHAEPREAPSVPDRARGAAHVVVAVVERVDPRFDRNEFGDELIVSRVRLNVSEVLKGAQARQIDVDVEGGTVGGLTLTVSDLPSLQAGQRAVFFLEGSPGRALKPHLRGHGILQLDQREQVRGEDLHLDDVRSLVGSVTR